MERRKPGPPGKGPRTQVKVRLPLPLAEGIRALAAQRGITVNDLLGEIMAEHTGIPYDQQEPLSLSA